MTSADGYVGATVKLVDHGPDALRWTMAFVGDGYRAEELDRYRRDVDRLIGRLSRTPPFDQLWHGINAYRIEVVSTDSGADDPAACPGGTGAAPRTYFDATFCSWWGGVRLARLLTIDSALALAVVRARVVDPDVVFCVVNSAKYGGSGGSVAVCSTNLLAAEIAIHEIGHTAFGLGDEYENGGTAAGAEPAEPNVTFDPNRATNKWRDLVAAATPMPSSCYADCEAGCVPPANPPSAGAVGAYEGAIYFHCGAYRPLPHCYMRDYAPFCPVCARVIRRVLAPYIPMLGRPMGAIAVDGGRPYVFVAEDSGRLWVDWWSGSAWAWGYQGAPASVAVGGAMGAVTVDGGRPYVFVQGGDGRLWVNWWSGSEWRWDDQGIPAGVAIDAAMGAVTVDGGRPYVFVKGGDGRLWVNWWSGSEWRWDDQGIPAGVAIGAAMGAITVDGGRPYVFVQGSDGRLWVNWWSGSEWRWDDQGTPAGVAIDAAMGAVTVDGGRPYVFVKGSDGRLWVNWWSGSEWRWDDQGTPARVTIGAAMGAVTVDGGRPYVFVKGSDGRLWVNWWSGSEWRWDDQGTPAGVAIGAAMGAVTVDGGRPYVFVKGSDGQLWVNWWSGSEWDWSRPD